MPFRTGGCQLRVSSPPGDSTLTTSAPRSASSIVAYGPARIREKSATSRPASGPVGRAAEPSVEGKVDDKVGILRSEQAAGTRMTDDCPRPLPRAVLKGRRLAVNRQSSFG